MGRWDSNTTIQFVALVLAIPGAVAAVATLWMLCLRRRFQHQGMQAFKTISTLVITGILASYIRRLYNQDSENSLAATSNAEPEDHLNARRAADWFQDQYIHLQRTVSAEREEWAEEMDVLHALHRGC